jgi:hypothetical protein
MGANLDGEMRRQTIELISLMVEIDKKAERQELHSDEWRYRYKLERDLEKILAFEEKNWQQWCSAKWVLQGDANTRFFHGVANGRRTKCSTFSLETEEGDIYDPIELRKHIEGYYKVLFGSEERGSMRLHEEMWRECGSLSVEEAYSLIKPFSEAKIKKCSGGDELKLGPWSRWVICCLLQNSLG